MSAFEVMDQKMDIRKQARAAITPKRALKEGIIKECGNLTLADVLGIIDEITHKFVQWMDGGAVAQTIYNCLYILDESLYKANPILLGYFTSILDIIYCTQEIFKICKSLREEDFTYSHILNKLVNDTPQQIEGKLTEAEKFVLSSEGTKELKNGLVARIKLMKGISALFHKFSKEGSKIEQCVKIIEYSESQLANIISTIDLGSPETSKCIDESVLYSFPIIFQAKKIPIYTKHETYEKIRKFLFHCRIVTELEQIEELQDIWKKLDDFMHNSPSVLIRAMLEEALFPNSELLYFGKIPLSDLSVKAISHYSKSAKRFMTNASFKEFMEKLSIMTRESMFVHLRTSARYRNDIEYFFNDLGILLNYAVSYFYYYRI